VNLGVFLALILLSSLWFANLPRGNLLDASIITTPLSPFLRQFTDRYEIGNENGEIIASLNGSLEFVSTGVQETWFISSIFSLNTFTMAIGTNSSSMASLLVSFSTIVLNFTATDSRPGVKISAVLPSSLSLKTFRFVYPWPVAPTFDTTQFIVNFGAWQIAYSDISQLTVINTYNGTAFIQDIVLPLITTTLTIDPADATETTVSCSPNPQNVGSNTICKGTVVDLNFPNCGIHCHPTGQLSWLPCNDAIVTLNSNDCVNGCTLANSGAFSSVCTVTYACSGAGTDASITASYPGDAFHTSSSGPVSPSMVCKAVVVPVFPDNDVLTPWASFILLVPLLLRKRRGWSVEKNQTRLDITGHIVLTTLEHRGENKRGRG